MRVVATKQGFDGLQLREADEEFDMVFAQPKKASDADGKSTPSVITASWFKPVSTKVETASDLV